MKIAERFNVIDVDTHIIEPPDLWTSRISSKWGDLVPHVKLNSRNIERWYMGEHRLPAAGSVAQAGWKDYPPSFPPTLAEADPAAWKAEDRLKRMDQYGIYTQVLYPNLLGFQCESFMKMADRQLGLECVSAYNDFLIDFCSISPDRLIALMWLPFWDIEASIKEVRRAAKLGHRGVIFGSDFSAVNLPSIGHPHWDPLLAEIQACDLNINFHIGFAAKTTEEHREYQKKVANEKHAFVKESTLMFMGNAAAIAEVLLSGVCDRFPKLKYVSVESGASWLPFLVESLDWQWKNSGAFASYPQRKLPSDYFRQHIYGSFWFEGLLLKQALELFPDNLMFETDFPHPTSLSPGPASSSGMPSEMIEQNLTGLSEEILAKVLHDNATKLYRLESPTYREGAHA